MSSTPIIGDKFYIACIFFWIWVYFDMIYAFSAVGKEKKIIPKAIQDKP